MKLALKLMIPIVLAIFLVSAVGTYFHIRREVRLYEQDIQSDHLSSGRALSNAVSFVEKTAGIDEAMKLVDNVNSPNNPVRIRWIWLEAPAGTPHSAKLSLLELQSLQNGEKVFRGVDWESRPNRIVSYFPLELFGSPPAALEFSESLEPEHAMIVAILEGGSLTSLGIVLLSGITTVILGIYLIGRPMNRLAEKARRIGRGDLSEPIDLKRKDELGFIAGEINAMCERLAEIREQADQEAAARLEAVEQLRHADRLTTVGKLSAGIAHELGTPLNVIAARARMIELREVSGNDAVECAAIIAGQSARMIRIVHQLLDFSRRRSPTKKREDMRLISRRILDLLEPMAKDRKVSLRLVGGETAMPADVDSEQIQQAMINLILNGIQAMKKHGGELQVTLRKERASLPSRPEKLRDCICIRIEDQGEGISPEDLPHLFDPFFTTKEVGEGTGLGLCVARGLIEEHDGCIEVSSEVGKGSLFSIYLPVPES
ncbi:MAG TPA: histidine kinase [Deltaproteobacteria bacterium]|nr:histidine kinase [Deltaproteobacteria bacterium]